MPAIRNFSIAFVVLLTFSVAAHADYRGKVVAIVDGDTLDVMHAGKAERVRLDGIDAPEKRQAFGTAARKYLSDLAFGHEALVIEKGHDRYRRTIGEVLVGGVSINRAMVRDGYAWWFRRYSTDQILGQLESEARAARRGLWADAEPVPPWDFRAPRTQPAERVD